MKQWDINWGIYRKEIVFADSAEMMNCGVDDLLRAARNMIDTGAAEYALDLIENLYIDLNSLLTIWTLDKHVSNDEKKKASEKLVRFLQENGGKNNLEDAEKEITSIQSSQLARIARATDEGKLYTYWGNDLCTNVDFSIRRGCSFTTSNPSKINLFRKEEPLQYAEYMNWITKDNPGLSKEERFSRMTVKVVSQVARKMRGIYEATNGKFGVSFTQVNPFTWDNKQAMIDEVRFWFGEFQRELGMEKPNVVFKMPATPAAKDAAKELLKDSRIRVTFTSNFAVGQHAPLYEVVDNRLPNCFLVIVDCHIRKYVREELTALNIDNLDYYCQQAYWAVYQKCYQNLIDRKSVAMINGAGMREDVGIRLCLSDCAENPVTVTMTPSLAAKFDSEQRDLSVIWNKPVSIEDIDVLNRSKTFRQSYYAEEFPWLDINSYKPYAFMMKGFYTAMRECMDAMDE